MRIQAQRNVELPREKNDDNDNAGKLLLHNNEPELGCVGGGGGKALQRSGGWYVLLWWRDTGLPQKAVWKEEWVARKLWWRHDHDGVVKFLQKCKYGKRCCQTSGVMHPCCQHPCLGSEQLLHSREHLLANSIAS